MTRTQLYARSLLVCMTMLLSYLGFAQNQNAPTLVKDVAVGTASSQLRSLVVLNTKAYFVANNGSDKLYQTDGTTNGTSQVTGYTDDVTSNVVAWNGQIYFTTKRADATQGTRILLYKTNGLTATFVDTLASSSASPSTVGYNLTRLYVENNQLFYNLQAVFYQGSSITLSSHNGQRNGAKLIAQVGAESRSGGATTYSQAVGVFVGTNTFYVYEEGGSFGNNSVVKNLSVVRNTSPVSERIIFQRGWFTSNPPPADFQFTALGVIGDFFYAINKDTLFRYDSTGLKTLIKTGVGLFSGFRPIKVGNQLYIKDGNNDLWRTDGTATGTIKLAKTGLQPTEILGDLFTDGTDLYVKTIISGVFPGFRRVIGNAITSGYGGTGQESSNSDPIFANGKVYFTTSPNSSCTIGLIEYNPTTNTNQYFPLVTQADCSQSIGTNRVVLPNNVVLLDFATAATGLELFKLDLNPPVVPLPDFTCKISNLSVDQPTTGYPRDPYTVTLRFTRTIIGTNLNTNDLRGFKLWGFVSLDSILSPDDELRSVQNLTQDVFSFNGVQEFVIPVKPLRTGLNYIIYKIDGANEIAESNENNNVSNAISFNAYALSCASNGIAPWNEWISNVKLNTINNTSEKTRYNNVFPVVTGYSNFLDISTSLNKGQTYPLSITPSLGYPTYPTNLFTRVWIDYNQNGVFEDAEIVLAKNGNQIATQNITVPATALLGTTAMRVSLKSGAYPTACESFDKGEVEDYTITIQAGTDPCLTDAIPPIISNCPQSVSRSSTGGCEIFQWTPPTATDNCGIPTVTFRSKSGTALSSSSTPSNAVFQVCSAGKDSIFYTATDGKGNKSICSFEIDVINSCAVRFSTASLPRNITLTTTGICAPYKWEVPSDFYPCARPCQYVGWRFLSSPNAVTPNRVRDCSQIILDSACFSVGRTVLIYAKNDGSTDSLVVTVQRFVNNTCRYQDSLQLVSLYNATVGANWTNKWNLATPINTWFGVTLNANGCVYALNLNQNNLGGTIPSSFTFSAIEELTLANTRMVGTIPTFNTPLLRILILESTLLTGTIPNINLPNLQTLSLAYNQLTGTVPNFNLPNLKLLSLLGNKLSGAIPNFNLPNLQTLNLSENLLTGAIPNFNLTKLQTLALQYNQLSGPLPNFNLPALQGLLLHYNQLSGTIPTLNLPNLGDLFLNNNAFVGAIPNFTLPRLNQLFMFSNQLTGCLPISLKSFCGKIVDISNNPNLATQDFAAFCASNTGACATPLPDFRMSAIVQRQGSDLTNTTYRAGIDGFGVDYTLVNDGGAYTLPATAFFYLSKDTILDSRDSLFTKLLAGATGTFLAGGRVPNLPDGDYFLIGKANGDNAIAELNVNNNVFVLKTPKVKIRSNSVTDLEVSLQAGSDYYVPYSTLPYRIVVRNRGTTPFTNVKVEFKFPANTVSGGTAIPTVGTWQEWCAGGVQCYTWTIPIIDIGAFAQIEIPLFILNTSASIVATARLLGSMPIDANVVNNSSSYTVLKLPAAPTTQALAFQVPTQLIPVVIQRISPNPTEGDVQIKLDSWTKQEADFNFSDITGKIIHSEKRALEKGINRVAFDVYHLPQGVYFIQTNVGKGRNVPTKFVKM